MLLLSNPLLANFALANCDANQCVYSNIPFTKAGFYVAQVRLEPGRQEGFWGLSVNTSGGINTGGFNAGTVLKENGQEPGFMGFYLNGYESVSLTAYEYSGQIPEMTVMIERQDLDTGVRSIVYGPTLMGNGGNDVTDLLVPGFYVASAVSQEGSARGRFGISLLGENFTGGVNIGGWIDEFTGDTGEGFGAFYVASPQTVNLTLLFGNSYGDKGSGLLNVTVFYLNPVTEEREFYWDSNTSISLNSAPTAHPITSSASAGETLQINLSGSDPDGDTLAYELLSPTASDAYDSAYIQGNILYLQISATFESLGNTTLEYRVTDGQQFSAPAPIVLQTSSLEEQPGLGLDLTDLRTYSEVPRSFLSGRLFGSSGLAPTLPPRVDLSDSFPIAGDQGNQGSCVGWATAYALKSYQERMEENWSLQTADGQPDYQHIFSPAFIYNQINGGQDGGSDPYEALQLIVEKGAATWTSMPYNDQDYWSQPTATASAEATQFKGAAVEVADGTVAIKNALASRLPVVAGIFIYDSFNYLTGQDAVYNDGTTVCEEYPACGHAVTIVGYDDDKFGGAFKVINSWGKHWGDNGYFWLPYEFAKRPAPWGDQQSGAVLAMSFLLRDQDNTGSPNQNPIPTPNPTDGDLPNLQVETWSASYDERLGGSGSLEYSIINTGMGTVPANAVDVNLMLSTDADLSSNDIYVVYETIPLDIGPGESVYRDQENNIPFYFPDNIPTGIYYMGVWVDDLNRVPESNEYDNISFGEQMVNIQGDLPDLVVNSWYTEWDDSGTGSLEYEISNQGLRATTVTDWDINLVLSEDDIIGNGNEKFIFYESSDYILQPEESVYRDTQSAATFQVYQDVSGDPIPEGIYYMALWVDDLNREQESNEYNNYSLGAELVVVGEDPFASFFRSSEKHENYNGKPLPNKVKLQKVELSTGSNGQRRVRFLAADEKAGNMTFDKQQSSVNQVIFPTARRLALPKKVQYGTDK